MSGVKNIFQVPFSEGYDIVEGAKAMQSGQGKCFKYCMSHPKGKIEIIGKLNDESMVLSSIRRKTTGIADGHSLKNSQRMLHGFRMSYEGDSYV